MTTPTTAPRPFTSDEAELRVIGAALIDPQAIAKLTNLRADDFYLGSHRNIWDAIVDLGEAADWGTVSTWLERRSLLEEVQALTGPLDIYLSTVAMRSVPTALNIEAYAAQVIELARRRELNNALSSAATANFKGESLPAIGGKLVQTMAKMEPEGKRPSLADILSDYSAEREAERDGTKTMGIPSGIGDLDRMTNGWKPGNLITIAGPTGGGKTTLLLGFALEAAKRGHKTVFVSLEMSNIEIMRKATAFVAGVNTGHSNIRGMRPEHWDAEHDAMNKIAGWPFIPVEAPGITAGGICELVHKENTRGQIGLVVADYVQIFGTESAGSRGESRATQIGVMTRMLKALAGQAKCAVMIGAQLNREFGQGGEPALHHLKESSSIEQDSNIVAMLFDPEDKAKPGARTLFVRKNRNGPVGLVPLMARFDLSRITGAARETIEL